MNSRILKNKFRRRGRVVVRDRAAVYHVICRAALQSFLFDAESKDMFRRMLYKQARFTGVEVLSYCLMDNHVHLLVRVPPGPFRPDGKHLLSDAEILKRYTVFYGEEVVPLSAYSVPELKAALAAGGEGAEEARRAVLARMGDLSAFMRELKQRFVIWYNATSGNVGTIWSARFKSLLVENSSAVLTRVAAYIDLNPIRAGIVKDPKEYDWCGYSAALRGRAEAQAGFRRLFPGDRGDYEELMAAYRRILYGIGTERGVVKLTKPLAEADTTGSSFLKRVRQFTEGLVLGSSSFVESVAASVTKGSRRRQAYAIDGNDGSAVYGTRRP